jgi:hypothetical protein
MIGAMSLIYTPSCLEGVTLSLPVIFLFNDAVSSLYYVVSVSRLVLND